MFLFDEEKQIFQIYFEMKTINKKYIKIYNEEKNLLTLEIPMKKKGNIINVIFDVDITKDGIVDCNYSTKIN